MIIVSDTSHRLVTCCYATMSIDPGSQFLVLSSQFSVLSSWFSVLGSQFSVLGSWFSVLGSQFSVLGSWFLVLGSRFLVLGSWFSVLGSRFSALGSRFLVLGSRLSVLGSRFSVLGSRFLVLNNAHHALLRNHRPGYRFRYTANGMRRRATSASCASHVAAGSADCAAVADADPAAHDSPVADAGTGAASTNEPA
jgi:hypothetical protein